MMPILAAVMVLCLVGGDWEAWRGNMGRCLFYLAIAIVIAAYAVLQSFVPGARR